MNKNLKYIVSLIIMLIAIIIIFINRFIYTLPDIVIRLSGIILLIGLALLSFFTVRKKKDLNR